MINRRGVPEEMLSGNGTNFVAANKELCKLLCEYPRTKVAIANMGDLLYPMLLILVVYLKY